MTKRVMKLLDAYSGHMICTVCGSEHDASIKPRSNGKYRYGSWQCVHKCKLPTAEEHLAFNGWTHAWIEPKHMRIPPKI